MTISGLIFIDTPYPKAPEDTNMRLALNGHLPELTGIRPQLRRKIHSSIKNARAMLASWQPPKWEAQAESMDRMQQDLKRMRNPPPAILLRASSALTKANEPVAVVDVFRHDRVLGWNEYDMTFIRVVWDIPGDHYSVFGARNVRQPGEMSLFLDWNRSKANQMLQIGQQSHHKTRERVLLLVS